MKSVIDILPIELENRHIEFIRKNYLFLRKSTVIYVGDVIQKLDEDITSRMRLLNGIDMSDATKEQINQMKQLIKNLLFINNIDYNDSKKLNYRVRGIEKWLKINNTYGSGAEGTIYKINIHFNGIISPDLAMKKNRNGAGPTELLKEFLNYYLISYLKDFTPNFIDGFGLVTCNTNKELINDIALLNSPVLCSCVGTLYCNQKNYMITKPFRGHTFQTLLSDNQAIILANLKNILLQIAYSLKIAQEKMEFLHNDLNDRNISLTVYDTPKTFTYIFNDSTNKEITSNVKVNIFDFGGSEIKRFNFLETVDADATNEYKRNFTRTNRIGDLLREYISIPVENPRKIQLRRTLYEASNTAISVGVAYDDALAIGMDFINGVFRDLVGNFGQETADYVTGIQTVFNQTSDIKNFIRTLLTVSGFPNGELKTKLQSIQENIAPFTTIDQVILNIQGMAGGAYKNQKFLRTILNEIRLQDIRPINEPVNGIDIDGYDSATLYGAEPVFNYLDIANDIDFYNLYGDIKNGTCLGPSGERKIYWGNPGYTKFVPDKYPLNWENKKPSELLPVPVDEDDMTSFTYAFVIDKYTDDISVRYGRITNLTEIGANHAIISYADKIIVSGEIAIVKKSGEIIYYINNNSSKMDPSKSNINFKNGQHPNTRETDNFYWILMINLSLRLFRAIDPTANIQISKNTKIKYGTAYDRRLYIGDDIVKYYSTKECPTDDFISKFNKFGKKEKIMNACIGFKEGDRITNMHTVRIGTTDILKCDWDNGNLQDKYYLKYLKYKNKYLNIKNSIKEI